MIMRYRRCARIVLGAAVLVALPSGCARRTSAAAATANTAIVTPDADVNALLGTYVGSWSTFAIDASGQVTSEMAWTDTITAVGPVDEPDRRYVNTTDVMIFSGGRIPPQRVAGKEGYLRNADGTLGGYFVEVMGQTTRMQRVAPDIWTSVTDAAPRELAALGVGATGRHVLVKVVSTEQGGETHRISRLTTVHWTAADGTPRAAQFVSLQGVHRRIVANR
jgi:hypothetical protein